MFLGNLLSCCSFAVHNDKHIEEVCEHVSNTRCGGASKGDWVTVPKSSVTGLLTQNVDSKHM